MMVRHIETNFIKDRPSPPSPTKPRASQAYTQAELDALIAKAKSEGVSEARNILSDVIISGADMQDLFAEADRRLAVLLPADEQD